MAFIRAKNINGKVKHYLVESKREGKKVRQKVLVYLGEADTIEGAIDELLDRIPKSKQRIDQYEQRARAAMARIPQVWIDRNGGEIPEDKNDWTPRRRDYVGQYWSYTNQVRIEGEILEKMEIRLDKLQDYQVNCSA